MMSEAFSPSMITEALVLPDMMLGNTEASAILSPSTPWTLNLSSTTESRASGPIIQVLVG